MLFWAIGAFSPFAAAVGIVDYTTRLVADVLNTTYLRKEITESCLGSLLLTTPAGGPGRSHAQVSALTGSTSKELLALPRGEC